MPHSQDGLPFQGATPLSAHSSWLGTEDAKERSETQTLRLLELYARRGPTTDWDAHTVLGWERTTVNARRRPLCQRGIVVAVDQVKNAETGVLNTRWGLA